MDNLEKRDKQEFVKGIMVGAVTGMAIAAYAYAIGEKRPKSLKMNKHKRHGLSPDAAASAVVTSRVPTGSPVEDAVSSKSELKAV